MKTTRYFRIFKRYSSRFGGSRRKRHQATARQTDCHEHHRLTAMHRYRCKPDQQQAVRATGVLTPSFQRGNCLQTPLLWSASRWARKRQQKTNSSGGEQLEGFCAPHHVFRSVIDLRDSLEVPKLRDCPEALEPTSVQAE